MRRERWSFGFNPEPSNTGPEAEWGGGAVFGWGEGRGGDERGWLEFEVEFEPASSASGFSLLRGSSAGLSGGERLVPRGRAGGSLSVSP